MGVLPDLKFTEVKKGLEHCLTEFLKRENFRSIPALVMPGLQIRMYHCKI